MSKSATIGIIGAGLMGHGIAYLMARAGYDVSVFDRSADALASLPDRLAEIAELLGDGDGTTSRITLAPELDAAVADAGVVIEAAIEDLAVKQYLVAELEALLPPDAIIASNTSAIPIARIAEKATHPARIVGTHFWNPPHLVKLVEVTQAETTSLETVERTMALFDDTGHYAVHVKKDVPGFIGNRLQHALKREAIAMVAAGICDAETLDEVVKRGFGSRLAVLGPMEQSDLVGLPLTRSIHDTLLSDLDRSEEPHPYLVSLIEAGKTGIAAGEGLRTWTPETADAVRKRLRDFLVSQAQSQTD